MRDQLPANLLDFGGRVTWLRQSARHFEDQRLLGARFACVLLRLDVAWLTSRLGDCGRFRCPDRRHRVASQQLAVARHVAIMLGERLAEKVAALIVRDEVQVIRLQRD